MSISVHSRVLPLFLIVFVLCSGSLFARPLITPELTLAVEPEKTSLDTDGAEGKNHKVPCAMSSSNDEVRLLKRFEDGNYESLFLSSLPKGSPVAPSGPSKRTNDFNY
ncbi:cytochrome c biosynthesis protein [Tanacetum coccineum]|uniref:Cytochrome c biosynthesis protein n=1 Tax=Tanacetum coccineum TaxID=301880 RepID=A0ABQ5ATR9_9ASTR